MKVFYVVSIVFASCLALANPAWAVQTHGGTEGLVSHLIGHILFVAGMGYLLFSLRLKKIKGVGWFEFKMFLWFIIAWNILTFSGHWMHEFEAADKFIKVDGHTIAFIIHSSADLYFYLTRLDHLLLVPAFFFLLLALRKWRVQV